MACFYHYKVGSFILTEHVNSTLLGLCSLMTLTVNPRYLFSICLSLVFSLSIFLFTLRIRFLIGFRTISSLFLPTSPIFLFYPMYLSGYVCAINALSLFFSLFFSLSLCSLSLYLSHSGLYARNC